MLGNISTDLDPYNRIPIVHRYIHQKILGKDSKLLKDIPLDQTKIDRVCMRRFLSRYMVPVEIQNTFLQEMEGYGLLRMRGKHKIEILQVIQR